jgi:hypothetical protein
VDEKTRTKRSSVAATYETKERTMEPTNSPRGQDLALIDTRRRTELPYALIDIGIKRSKMVTLILNVELTLYLYNVK